jgi:hypothetical protein
MPDEFERRSRLVVLAYSVLGAMDLPTPETSDREILSAMADVALQKAAQLAPETPVDAADQRPASTPRPMESGAKLALASDTQHPQSDGTAQGDSIGA